MADNKPKGRDYPLASTPKAEYQKGYEGEYLKKPNTEFKPKELYSESEKKMIQDRMAKSGKIKSSDSGFTKGLPKTSEKSDLGFTKGLPKTSKTIDSGFTKRLPKTLKK
jgi:hypothetical protein